MPFSQQESLVKKLLSFFLKQENSTLRSFPTRLNTLGRITAKVWTRSRYTTRRAQGNTIPHLKPLNSKAKVSLNKVYLIVSYYCSGYLLLYYISRKRLKIEISENFLQFLLKVNDPLYVTAHLPFSWSLNLGCTEGY